MITTYMPTMNTSVGRRKVRALVAMPRRLSAVSNPRMAKLNHRLSGLREGKADTSAATPAAMDTATVRT